MNTLDKIASAILAGLAFTAAWWAAANAPDWLLFAALIAVILFAVVSGLIAIAACLNEGRIDHADENRRAQKGGGQKGRGL